MPLDTSTTYRLTRLRLDGRRWNELRLIQAQISTNPASSGSSYLAMGNTVILCMVHGPAEGRSQGTPGGGAVVSVTVNIAGFAGIDRKKKSALGGADRGSDKSMMELSTALRDAFQPHLHTHLYPHSMISIHVSVLSMDGSLLAACINACTLALVDAGIPMPGLLCGCTIGMSGQASTPTSINEQSRVGGINESLDPLLDMSLPEEQELPHMTVATSNSPLAGQDETMGEEDEDQISIIQMESGVHISYLETMFAVGIDGCKQVRQVLNGVLKAAGRRILAGDEMPSSEV